MKFPVLDIVTNIDFELFQLNFFPLVFLMYEFQLARVTHIMSLIILYSFNILNFTQQQIQKYSKHNNKKKFSVRISSITTSMEIVFTRSFAFQ